MIDKNILVAAALLWSSTAMAATYYVSPTGADSNLGTTQSAPWRTLRKAAAAMVAGDTAIAMNGTYVEPEVAFLRSGTASARITLKAQNKHQAILSSISACNPNISAYASYITIEDMRLEINAANVNCTTGSTAGQGGVFCWPQGTPSPSNPTTGYVGCHIRGVSISADSRRWEGIKTRQDFALVEGCDTGAGMEDMLSNGAIYRNNLITGPDGGGGGIIAKGGARNFQAYGNTVYITTPWGTGITLGGYSGNQYLFDPVSGLEGYNQVAYSNVVINKSGVSNVYGLLHRAAKDSAFYNNVVIGAPLTAIHGGTTGVASINPIFKNNIVDCGGGAATSFEDLYTGTLTIDHNNFYNCTGLPAQTNPISGNPLFVNRLSDWHLQPGSPAINSGAALSPFIGYSGESLDVSKDFNAIARTAPWDLGIYNVSGSPLPPTPLTVAFAAPTAGQVFQTSGLTVNGAPMVQTTVTIRAAGAVKVELSRDSFAPFYTWTAPTSSTDTYAMSWCVNCFTASEPLPRSTVLHAVVYDSAGGTQQAAVTVTVTDVPPVDTLPPAKPKGMSFR